MWKKLSGRSPLFFISSIVLFFCFTSNVSAQNTGSYRDGNPVFAKFSMDTTLTKAVTIDSVVLLNFKIDSASAGDNLRRFPDGVDKNFNTPPDKVLMPDPSYIAVDPNQERLYVVLDGFDRKILVINDAGQFRSEIRSNPDSDSLRLERPIAVTPFVADSAYAFDGNQIDTGILDKVKYVVTDQGREEVKIFDKDLGGVEWIYPDTTIIGFIPLSQPSSALVIPGMGEILICDTDNDRILRINKLTYQPVKVYANSPSYGTLNRPVDVEWTPEGMLITDRDNHRVILIDPETEELLWQFGTTGMIGSDDESLNSPVDADYLASSDILIADAGNKRTFQVDRNNMITWRFLGQLSDLKAVHRLEDPSNPHVDKTLVISDNPLTGENALTRLSYAVTDTIEVDFVELPQEVDFLNIKWQAVEPPGTRVRLQVRASGIDGGIKNATWLGPDSLTAFYTLSGQALNPLLDGKNTFQVRLEFQSADPLRSAFVSQIELTYRFFDKDTPGVFTSEEIFDPLGRTITAWDSLTFNTILPFDLFVRNDVQLDVAILNAEVDSLPVLTTFQASPVISINKKTQTELKELKTIQKIRLRAIFNTNNTSASSILDNWSIHWSTTGKTIAQIRFTDANQNSIDAVTTIPASDPRRNRRGIFFISLSDSNLIEVPNLGAIEATVFSIASKDTETVSLNLQNGRFITDTGTASVIQELDEFVTPGNNIMEVRDRDSLIVTYTDPTDPLDIARDTLIVLQFTPGILTMETRFGIIPDTARVTFQDTIFLRVEEEHDHDLSPAQDVITAFLFDNDANDEEQVTLFELPLTPGGSDFSTGEFVSQIGVPVENTSVGVIDNGALQTRPNNIVGARYPDVDTTLTVSRQVEAGPDVFIRGDGAFEIWFAPNPFRPGGGATFLMRMKANTGAITLKRIEIFNLAGEKIRTVDPALIDFVNPLDARSVTTSRNQWWNILTDGGASAASGTYWAKCIVDFQEDVNSPSQERTFIRKFIIIHQ